jgi:hypothetical protein
MSIQSIFYHTEYEFTIKNEANLWKTLFQQLTNEEGNPAY